MGQIFDTILINPIINILLAIYQLLTAVSIPYALGFAIILLTIVIRLLLYPLTASQLLAAKKMQQVTPHLNKLKERHKGDAKRLQQETMKLYQEHGINPLSGCLPILIQLPIIWALYAVLNTVVNLKPQEILAKINSIAYLDVLRLHEVWDTNFFGLPLGHTPHKLLESVGVLILLVPILTGVFQFIQSKMMIMPKPANTGKSEKSTESEFQSALATQSLYIFPLMIGFFSFNFPIGLSLYWNTFTIFGIIQQYKIQGLGGLSGLLTSIKPKIK